MDVGAKVFPVEQHVPVLLRVAHHAVVGDAVERRHHEVDAPPGLEHDPRGAQLGVEGAPHVRVAAREADGLLGPAEAVQGGVGARGRRVHEELHPHKVGGPDLGLDVEVRPAVGRQADQLGVDVHLGQEQFAPAGALAPVWQERAPHARVEHDKALVPPVQLLPAGAEPHGYQVPPQHLAVGAQVVACVWPVDGANVGGALGDQKLLGGDVVHAIEDENEVGGGVQTVVEEEAQVVARDGGVGEGVEDQRAPWVVAGRREGAIERAAGGVELAFVYVRVDWLFRLDWSWGGEFDMCSGMCSGVSSGVSFGE